MSADPGSVVLHLGAHKTASSLIQKFLRDRPEEAARLHLGVVGRSEGNRLFGWGDKTVTRAARTRDRIAELLAEPHVHQVVISHENALGRPLRAGGDSLYPDARALAADLAEVCQPWSTRIIWYVRPQHEFLESYYLQTVHQGGTATFAQWTRHLDLAKVSWRPVVDALAQAFGDDRLVVADFSEIELGQKVFLERFLRRVNPSSQPEVHYRARRNPSIGDVGLDIGLALNGHLESADERKAVRTFLQSRFSNHRYPRPILFTSATIEELAGRYTDEYRQLTEASVDG